MRTGADAAAALPARGVRDLVDDAAAWEVEERHPEEARAEAEQAADWPRTRSEVVRKLPAAVHERVAAVLGIPPRRGVRASGLWGELRAVRDGVLERVLGRAEALRGEAGDGLAVLVLERVERREVPSREGRQRRCHERGEDAHRVRTGTNRSWCPGAGEARRRSGTDSARRCSRDGWSRTKSSSPRFNARRTSTAKPVSSHPANRSRE